MSGNLQFTVLADVIIVYDECSCVSRYYCPPRTVQTHSQWRCRNCSCGMRAVEKVHAMSTKTGIILEGVSKSTSCQRILRTPITAERTSVSGRRSSARIARATRRCLSWVDYLIPCPSWQWSERGKVSSSRRTSKLHFIFYFVLKWLTLCRTSASIYFHFV